MAHLNTTIYVCVCVCVCVRRRACNPDVVCELLNAGAQPNGRDRDGNTVLHALYNVRGVPQAEHVLCADDPEKDAMRLACAQQVSRTNERTNE